MQVCAFRKEKEWMNFQPIFVIERKAGHLGDLLLDIYVDLWKFSHFSVKQEVRGQRGRRVQGLREEGVVQNGHLSGWRVKMLRGSSRMPPRALWCSAGAWVMAAVCLQVQQRGDKPQAAAYGCTYICQSLWWPWPLDSTGCCFISAS